MQQEINTFIPVLYVKLDRPKILLFLINFVNIDSLMRKVWQNTSLYFQGTGVKRSKRENRVEENICKPLKKMKALRERDHRLKLQQCAAVMKVITWLSEPQITPTLLHLEPTAGERKSLTLFKGVSGGSGKGHIQRNNAIRVFHQKLCILFVFVVFFLMWEEALFTFNCF